MLKEQLAPVSIVPGDHGCMFCFRWTAPLTCLPLSSYLLKMNLMCTNSLRPHPAIFGSIHTQLITCCMLRFKTFHCVTCTNAPSVFVLLLLWNKWISPLTWSRSLTDGLVAFCFVLSVMCVPAPCCRLMARCFKSHEENFYTGRTQDITKTAFQDMAERQELISIMIILGVL